MLIPRPFYPAPFDFVDVDLSVIAQFIRNEVNLTFANALGGRQAILTYTTDNTKILPLGKVYPLLKIYRVQERFYLPISAPKATQIVIAYVLSYSSKDKAPGVTTYVAEEICRIIQNSNEDDGIPFTSNLDEGVAVEYNTITENTDIVYNYAKLTCSIMRT